MMMSKSANKVHIADDEPAAARASQARASQELGDGAPQSAIAAITKNCSAPIQVRKYLDNLAACVWNDVLASVTLSHTSHAIHTNISSIVMNH